MLEAHTLRLANRLGAVAVTLGDGVRDAVEGATGLSGGAPAALVSLHEWADGSSVEVLADAMRVSHSRAVRVVDRLEESGLARRERSTDDGRRALVFLEPDGRRLAEKALHARSVVLEKAVGSLDDPAAEALGRALAALLGARADGTRAARGICRLCDAHACGHYDGDCPVSHAADRARASNANG
jgi:DNA-binding MarR family transcriptional regulator